MVPLEPQRRAVPEERRFEARVTPQGRRESSRSEPRAGMTAETGSSELARLGPALVQPDRGGPGRTFGCRAIALDRSRRQREPRDGMRRDRVWPDSGPGAICRWGGT